MLTFDAEQWWISTELPTIFKYTDKQHDILWIVVVGKKNGHHVLSGGGGGGGICNALLYILQLQGDATYSPNTFKVTIDKDGMVSICMADIDVYNSLIVVMLWFRCNDFSIMRKQI